MGDQPEAVDTLAKGILNGNEHRQLWESPGPARRLLWQNWIERVQKPTLVISHNKTLAAQLHGEFKSSFRRTQWNTLSPIMIITSLKRTWLPPIRISRKILINAEIEKLRHSATAALSERRDVIIVASVSCI